MITHCTCDGGKFFAAWQIAVAEYTSRRLSEPTDKLPALAGLAQMFFESRTDKYLAGLWRSRLIHDLMWKSEIDLQAPKGDVNKGRRRHAWRAPSWSWACIDGRITVVGAHNRILECQLDRCSLPSQRETAHVVDCGVELQDKTNPFGAVKSGFVTLKGPLIKATLLRGKAVLGLVHPEMPALQGAVSDLTHLDIMSHPDEFAKPELDLVNNLSLNEDLKSLGSEEDGADVWCLQMREEVVKPTYFLGGRSERIEVTLMDGLILTPIEGEADNFRRIGVWVTYYRVVVEPEQHPLGDTEPVVLTII